MRRHRVAGLETGSHGFVTSPSVIRRAPFRFVAGVVTLATLAVPALAASSAFGDPISDKRRAAARAAARPDPRQDGAEGPAEQYNDARLALGRVQAKVAATKARVEAPNAHQRRR